MSRYIKEYKISGSAESLRNFASQFFISNGFVYKEYHGEQVYQKGSGLMVGPKFVRVDINESVIHFEAWVKFAVLPGVYSGEMDLEGTAGIATKKPLKTIMTNFENQLLQMGCTPVSNPQMQYAQPAKPAQSQNTKPVQQQVQRPAQSQYTQSAQPQRQSTYSQNQAGGYAYSANNNAQAAVFCSNCGNRLAPNSIFCSKCGKKVN